MDGLALSLALVTSYLAYRSGNQYTWLPFSGLIAGVLLWNFPNARTFLGDGGATLLGYVCSSHLAWDIFPRFFNVRPVVMLPVLVLIGGMPVIDTLVAMVRRILTGRSPFYPDRGHLHHMLLDRRLKGWEALSLIVVVHAVIVSAGYYILNRY
jgi:UDP-GlcNAc:undecaprenyl-phosphate GlcNAc-1-phosphate transferase